MHWKIVVIFSGAESDGYQIHSAQFLSIEISKCGDYKAINFTSRHKFFSARGKKGMRWFELRSSDSSLTIRHVRKLRERFRN